MLIGLPGGAFICERSLARTLYAVVSIKPNIIKVGRKALFRECIAPSKIGSLE